MFSLSYLQIIRLVLGIFVLRSFVFSQRTDWETVCVTGTDGVPIIILENHFEHPIIFNIECTQKTLTVYVDPDATYSQTVYFPWNIGATEDNCILTQRSETTYHAKVYANVFGLDYVHTRYNFTSCPLLPGVEERTQVYTDCEADPLGNVKYYIVNNLFQPVSLHFDCYEINRGQFNYQPIRKHYGINVAPRTGAVMELSHHVDYTNQFSNCVVLPDNDGFYYFPYYIFTPDYLYYLEAVVYCKERTLFDVPIVEVIPHCPYSGYELPKIELVADVPAYAVVHCRNGEAHLSSASQVSAVISATFYQGETSYCQFYKQDGANVFSVVIEVGWGVQQRELFLSSKTETLTCVYEGHGDGSSQLENVGYPFWSPEHTVVHRGGHIFGSFEVKVLDVLNRQVNTRSLASGKLIRLRISEYTGNNSPYRAFSCSANNGVTSYSILDNGCGDGFIIDRNEGFLTSGSLMYSPFFQVFKLRGGSNIWFDCQVIECDSHCDGSSCSFVGDRENVPTHTFHRFGPGDK